MPQMRNRCLTSSAMKIAGIAVIARNRRDRKNQIPAMSAIPGDSGD